MGAGLISDNDHRYSLLAEIGQPSAELGLSPRPLALRTLCKLARRLEVQEERGGPLGHAVVSQQGYSRWLKEGGDARIPNIAAEGSGRKYTAEALAQRNCRPSRGCGSTTSIAVSLTA
jgi:hypothetical protein